jgi:hypothetical protein
VNRAFEDLLLLSRMDVLLDEFVNGMLVLSRLLNEPVMLVVVLDGVREPFEVEPAIDALYRKENT